MDASKDGSAGATGRAAPGAPTAPPPPLAAHAALAAVQVLFGLWPVIGVVALRAIGSSAALVGVRLFVGAPILAIASGVARQPLPSRADLARLAGLAALGISLNQLLFVEGLSRAGPVHASVLGLLIPPFTVVIAAVTGRERPTALRLLGVACSFVGAAILVRPDRLDLAGAGAGDLLIVASSTAYSAYLVAARGVVARLGASRTVSWVMLLGAVEAAPFVVKPLLVAPWGSLSPAAWAAVAFVVIGATVLTYLLNAFALARVPSSLVALYVAFQPLIATATAAVFLGAEVSPNIGLAAATLALGLVLATR